MKGPKPMQAGRKYTNRTVEFHDVLPPEPAMRRESMRHMRPVLVEDAVFEVVTPAPGKQSHNDNPGRGSNAGRIDPTRLAAIAGVCLVNQLERLLGRLSTQAFATLSASLFFIVFWFCGGFGALDARPLAQPPMPFVIERVFTEEVDENGMRLLVVGGMLRNHSAERLSVPTLSVVGEGGVVIGSINPTSPELASGQSMRFFGRFQLAGGKYGAVTIFPAPK